MSDIGKRTIYVGGGVNSALPRNVEGIAVASTPPGTLLSRSASGLTAAAKTAFDFSQEAIFADKDQLRSKSVDDAWVINENMVAILGRSGDILNVLVATAQTLAIGDAMITDAAGLLLKATDTIDDGTTGTQKVICYADEAIVTSGTELVRVTIA